MSSADQISQNLLQVPGYNPMLNKLVLWMLVVTPLYAKILCCLPQTSLIFGHRTKFPLCTRPLNLALEALCGLDSHTQDNGFEANQKLPVTQARKLNRSLKRVLVACERISFLFLAVTVSILVPEFGSIMAILGSFSVFTLCVIGPVAAKISLDRKATIMDVAILLSSTVMALWGTGAAFWSTTRMK
jgi:solute carrier family 32 (vesicular inhibitory amino acid transporter)